MKWIILTLVAALMIAALLVPSKALASVAIFLVILLALAGLRV